MLLAVKENFPLSWCLTVLLINYSAVCESEKINWPEINEICGVSYANRIVGGTTAELGQFPWIAHLAILRKEAQDTWKLNYECGGALIHPRFVLTAAHCAVGLEEGETLAAVKLGEHNLDTRIDCEFGQCADPPQVIYPKTVIVPKEHESYSLNHDLAIIELMEPANITRYVSPICLPTGDAGLTDLIGQIVEVAGWGYYDIDDPKASPILQVVKLPIVPLEKCKNITQLQDIKYVEHGQICAGGVKGRDSCNGDSGGPLVKVIATQDQGPRYFLFGIVSVGVPSCGKYNLPAVYTNISHYMPWIMYNIEN